MIGYTRLACLVVMILMVPASCTMLFSQQPEAVFSTALVGLGAYVLFQYLGYRINRTRR